MKFFVSIIFIILMALDVNAQSSLQESHINANLPPTRAEFDSLMARDLKSYFKNRNQKASSIDYKLLRDSPTQSGDAYPKFYAWIQVRGKDDKVLDSGAVRVAVIEKRTVEVTDFVSSKEINADANRIEKIFPAALCPSIREKARNP